MTPLVENRWNAAMAGSCVLLLVVFGWGCLKVLVAFVMVSAGVDWPGMNDGDKLNAVVGVGIGLIGLYLGVQANRISKRQKEIAEEQHRWIEEANARHARFDLTCPEIRGHSGGDRGFTLWVTNVGRRASRGIVYLGVPKRIRQEVELRAADGIRKVPVLHSWDIRDETLDHPGQLHFHDDYELHKFELEQELFPLDRRLCATVVIPYRRENMRRVLRTFHWFTQTADERNPASDTNEIVLGNPSQSNYDWDSPETPD